MRATSILFLLSVVAFVTAFALRFPVLQSASIFAALCFFAAHVLSSLLKKPE